MLIILAILLAVETFFFFLKKIPLSAVNEMQIFKRFVQCQPWDPLGEIASINRKWRDKCFIQIHSNVSAGEFFLLISRQLVG